MDILNRFCRFLNRAFLIMGGISMLALTFLATGNVVFRVFDMPYRGAYEIVSFLGAMITAFSLGYTQRQKDHIVVDIISSRYPHGIMRFLDIFNYLVMSVFFGIISWYLFAWSLKIKASGELSENLQVIYYPFVMVVSAGFAVYAFTLLVDFINTLRKEKS